MKAVTVWILGAHTTAMYIKGFIPLLAVQFPFFLCSPKYSPTDKDIKKKVNI